MIRISRKDSEWTSQLGVQIRRSRGKYLTKGPELSALRKTEIYRVKFNLVAESICGRDAFLVICIDSTPAL